MKLNYRDHPIIADRSALKPKVGDTVIYEGKEFIVTRLGMRWINAQPVGQDPIRNTVLLPLKYVIKKMSTSNDSP